ncbi:MAG: substrate-binding domain-containing protein [Lachnospiraceae bacterium]|nr:substrate-binding domain-containing protein [Lachnospiraceae bacterium]
MAATAKTRKIGAVSFDLDHPFFGEMKDGMEDEAERLGVSLAYRACDFSVKSQLDAVDDIVKAEKIELLLLTASNDPAIVKKIAELDKKGIPVVTVHSDIPDSKRKAYVGADSYKSGTIAAGLMGRMAPPDKSLEVGIVTGDPHVFAHNERMRGFKEYLALNFPKITVDAIVASEDDDYRCYEDVQKMIADFPMIRGLFFTAGGVYGGCKALFQLTTRMKFHVITMAEVPSTLDFMKKGVIDMTVVEDAEKQGRVAIRVASEVLSGQEVDERILTKNAIRTKECLY